MNKNNPDQKVTRTATTGPNGASDGRCAALFRLRPRELHNKFAVHHIIAALRAIGALCAEVGNMLDAQIKTGSPITPRQPTRDWPEVRGVSLDPSTFVDPEEEEGKTA
jgi:hypothetical protein